MRLRLHHRVVLPFAAIAIVAIAAVAWTAFRVTTRTITAHLGGDIARAAAVIGRSGLALNPAVLGTVKQITGADVVTLEHGRPTTTTLDGPERDRLIADVTSALGDRQPEAGAPLVFETDAYFVAAARVAGRADDTILLLRRTDEARAAIASLRNAIAGATITVIALALAIGALTARRVTAPIERLGAFARTVTLDAPSRERAPTGSDEIGRLGHAFNDMLVRLEEAQGALVKSEKLSLAGLFAARVAHDVRNPLSAMRMQTQLLRSRAAVGTETHEIAAALLEDINQVETVVKGLLEVANPSPMVVMPRQINDLVEGVVRQIGAQSRHRQIRVSTSLADLPPVPVDASRLTQALLNLVINAMEAMREGGTLAITTQLTADGRAIRIDVDDDGIGIDAAGAARLFDPFVTTKDGGVGLGLVNAKAAVESHGGTIALAPRRPAGTRATIVLPATDRGASHG